MQKAEDTTGKVGRRKGPGEISLPTPSAFQLSGPCLLTAERDEPFLKVFCLTNTDFRVISQIVCPFSHERLKMMDDEDFFMV